VLNPFDVLLRDENLQQRKSRGAPLGSGHANKPSACHLKALHKWVGNFSFKD
jgi:hypothetical protein